MSITTRCGLMLGIGMGLPRKRHGTKLGHGMCVLCMISVSGLCLCLGDTVLYIDYHVDGVDGR